MTENVKNDIDAYYKRLKKKENHARVFCIVCGEENIDYSFIKARPDIIKCKYCETIFLRKIYDPKRMERYKK